MKIEATCVCGAKFSLDDDRSIYIVPGGKPDKDGRMFQCELVFDRWRMDHAAHAATSLPQNLD